MRPSHPRAIHELCCCFGGHTCRRCFVHGGAATQSVSCRQHQLAYLAEHRDLLRNNRRRYVDMLVANLGWPRYKAEEVARALANTVAFVGVPLDKQAG